MRAIVVASFLCCASPALAQHDGATAAALCDRSEHADGAEHRTLLQRAVTRAEADPDARYDSLASYAVGYAYERYVGQGGIPPSDIVSLPSDVDCATSDAAALRVRLMFAYSDPSAVELAQLAERALRKRGPDDPVRAGVLDLSITLRNAAPKQCGAWGCLSREQALRESLRIRRKAFGNGDPRTRASIASLAALLDRGRRPAEAQRLYRELLDGPPSSDEERFYATLHLIGLLSTGRVSDDIWPLIPLLAAAVPKAPTAPVSAGLTGVASIAASAHRPADVHVVMDAAVRASLPGAVGRYRARYAELLDQAGDREGALAEYDRAIPALRGDLAQLSNGGDFRSELTELQRHRNALAAQLKR